MKIEKEVRSNHYHGYSKNNETFSPRNAFNRFSRGLY